MEILRCSYVFFCILLSLLLDFLHSEDTKHWLYSRPHGLVHINFINSLRRSISVSKRCHKYDDSTETNKIKQMKHSHIIVIQNTDFSLDFLHWISIVFLCCIWYFPMSSSIFFDWMMTDDYCYFSHIGSCTTNNAL
jgi:hypothetical protein